VCGVAHGRAWTSVACSSVTCVLKFCDFCFFGSLLEVRDISSLTPVRAQGVAFLALFS
jgi:hypothetical protein